MFPAVEIRIAVAYLLIMKIAVRFWLSGGGETTRITLSERLLTGRTVTAATCLSQLLYLLPLVIYVAAPDLLHSGQLDVPVLVSWIAIGLATAVIFVFGWAWRAVSSAFLGEVLEWRRLAAKPGPFRSIRYPCEAAQMVFHVLLSIATGNWLIVGCALCGSLIQRCAAIPPLERLRSAQWPDAYPAYAAATGVFIPQIDDGGAREYTVPRRFGMAAIIALFTTLGILFGVLRYWEASPVIYLFVTSEIVAICLAQIVFGSAPRSVSILLGAMLLPFWVYINLRIEGQTRPPYIAPFWVYVMFGSLFAFGGLLGYCIGTLAAGFFLVMDLVETAWEGPSPSAWPPASDAIHADHSGPRMRPTLGPARDERA